MSDLFKRFSLADVAMLIADYPLAWVCAMDGNAGSAVQLPLIGEYDADGTLVALVGHLPKDRALVREWQRDSRALILFSGPSGYVSPEHAGRRDWGPTWNFAHLRIAATIVPDEALTRLSLEMLVDAVECGRPAPWHASELGGRYAPMAARVIGFRAQVASVHGRFKLGQDERLDTLRTILAHHPDAALVRWMRRFNPGRC